MLLSKKTRQQGAVSTIPALSLALLLTLLTSPTGLAQADESKLLRSSGLSVAGNQATGNQALDVPLAGRLSGTGDDPSRSSGSGSFFGGPLATIIGGLAITLGVFCCFVAVVRRGEHRGLTKQLPAAALEVLGHTSLGPRQRLVVVRCGMQALILGVSPAGIEQVGQIDDPDEAGQFIAQCRGTSAATSFRATLQEIEREPHAAGFVDGETSRAGKKPGNRLFLRG